MRVIFLFNSGNTFEDFFEVEFDWNYPVLPRLNEHFAPSFIMKVLTPKEFYEKLNNKQKKQWDDRMDEYKNELPREQVERDSMINIVQPNLKKSLNESSLYNKLMLLKNSMETK